MGNADNWSAGGAIEAPPELLSSSFPTIFLLFSMKLGSVAINRKLRYNILTPVSIEKLVKISIKCYKKEEDRIEKDVGIIDQFIFSIIYFYFSGQLFHSFSYSFPLLAVLLL